MERSRAGPNSDLKKRFGVFEFDEQARELTKHGIRLKLHDQPIQVLAALLEQAGQVVPREELQRRLWPDGTFVDYEQSLNKAVNKLREALGDSADHPIYIETLARRGYRFLAPVEGHSTAKLDVQTAVPWRRVLPWLAAGGLVLAIVFAAGLWPIDVPRVERVVRLTNDTNFKYLPLVSDGNRVLYRARSGIWSVPISGGEPKRLSLPFLLQRGIAGLSGYSPIRQQILLRVWGTAQSDAQELWLVGLEGEAPRKIAEIRPPGSVDLAPDAERIALGMPDGVYIQSIANAERKRVHPMKWQVPGAVWWHPSGHRVGFLDGSGELSKSRAWQVDDDGAHPRRIVPENERPEGAGVWSADGKRFFYSSPEGEIFLRTQAGILGWLRKPVIDRLTASGQFGSRPAIDPFDPRRFYALGKIERGETVRYDRKARKWVSFLAGFSGEAIDRSPDGQWMAYISFPGAQLHKCKIDGSGDVLLAPGVYAMNPGWSPDGKRIAFPGRPAGTNGPLELWLVSADGGDASPYRPEIESGYDTIWSKDGTRILMGQENNRNLVPGRSCIKILHLNTGTLQVIPGGDRLFSPRWSRDEKQILALDVYHFNPHIFDSVKREWRELAKWGIGYPNWSNDGRYVYAWSPPTAIRIEVATGRREEIARMDFGTRGNLGIGWLGWTEDWDPLTVRDLSSVQIYRIDLNR